ncbi:MAG: 4-hydroxy-tetrahydrodipicolinate synthase [Bacteroidetes bacterium]|nr:4-hydroxy-tetrahydrodipicolinate synthase [Bacteroidota bacterium]
MSKYSKFRGTGVALVTPFHKDGAIDFKSLGKVIDHIISGGVEYMVSLGTTGETPVLSKEEKKSLVKYTVEHVNKRVPVVVGIGGNNTREVIDTFKQYDLKGVDAILSVSPYYNKPNQRGIIEHYKAIGNACPLPMIVYNVPGRTCSNITAETTLQLAEEVKNIFAVKEASGNFDQIMKLIKYKPKDFLVISGDDLITLPILASGGDGVISVIANAFPKEFSEMVRMAIAGNYSKAQVLHYKLDEFTRLIFSDGSPAGVKCLMEMMKICSAHVRLPLVNVNSQVAKSLAEHLISLK